MKALLLLLLSQVAPLNGNTGPVVVRDEGVRQGSGSATTINCVGAGVACTKAGATMTLTVAGGGGGGSGAGGAPADGGFLTLTAGSTGSTNEKVLSAGTNISITAGGVVSVTGTVASSTSAGTATALASDPVACGAGSYVSDVSAAGVLTCSTPPGTYALPDSTSGVTGGIRLTGDLAGTATSPSVVDDSHAHTSSTISALDVADITTGTLSQARGGTGAGAVTCTAGDFITSNGTAYSCATPTGSGGGLSFAQTQRLSSIGGP
jgi:hypothetical protein